LDRDVALQPRVVGTIDLAHPTRSDERADLILIKPLADRQGRWFGSEDAAGELHRGCFEKIGRVGSARQQRLYFSPEIGIAVARPIEIGRTRIVVECQRVVIDLANPLPAVRVHDRDSVLVRSSSRRSHVLASFQSRITVAAEMSSALAISSLVSPPKKRITTIWLCRALTRASTSRASSSASTSCPRPMSMMPESSKGTCWTPAPR